MIGDNPRLLELRRRVQADPASIVFAQLAEECRRAGANDEAVAICRAGLKYRPDYFSARVTLGRALIELGQLNDAETELNIVLKAAPDNLAASRALAEIFQRRGQLPQALALYRKVLDLATFDPDLESEVQRIETAVSPSPPPAPVELEATQAKLESLFDFDTLLEQLGGHTPRSMAFDAPANIPVPSALDAVELREDDSDPFSLLERKLRDDDKPPAYQVMPTEDEFGEQRLLSELEDWLAAIAVDRQARPSA